MCVAFLLAVQHHAVLAVHGGEGRHEAEAAQVRAEASPHVLVKRDMFADFQVPAVSWQRETEEPVMEDRTGLLQLFLLNQALNTRHPPEQKEEKVVRCFRVPKTQHCTRTQFGPWEHCEVKFIRECYMYTYIVQQP